MEPKHKHYPHQFFSVDRRKVLQEIGQAGSLRALKKMLLIRNFETRAESAYQQGKIGGFFHSYIGQEAIQTSAVETIGENNWWITSYRCHALALLLGATPNEIMAELYGRATGNAKGRGGSMHLYTERLLGGFGIVGGQIPIATGAAFAVKYQGKKEEIAVCFFGDGAVPQGAFHESLNLAALWNLPCLYVVENNLWGMGTAYDRANSVLRLAEDKAPSFGIKGYTFDGMSYLDCYAGFQHVHKEILADSRPVLVEVITDRFKGHSISDPGLYRTKDQLRECMLRDPIALLKAEMIEAKFLTEEEYTKLDKEAREVAVASMQYAEESPWPDPITLEEDVFAP